MSLELEEKIVNQKVESMVDLVLQIDPYLLHWINV